MTLYYYYHHTIIDIQSLKSLYSLEPQTPPPLFHLTAFRRRNRNQTVGTGLAENGMTARIGAGAPGEEVSGRNRSQQ